MNFGLQATNNRSGQLGWERGEACRARTGFGLGCLCRADTGRNPKPRGGGLFIDRPSPTTTISFCFSAAPPRDGRKPRTSSPPLRGHAPPLAGAPPKNKKKDRGGPTVYKQVTPYGGLSHAPISVDAAFTLAEVLAALVFMAILIPVALEGLSLASRAGEVAARKSEAAMVAERVLNENVVTTNWNTSVQNGVVRQGIRDFHWTLRNDPWDKDPNQSVIRTLL